LGAGAALLAHGLLALAASGWTRPPAHVTASLMLEIGLVLDDAPVAVPSAAGGPRSAPLSAVPALEMAERAFVRQEPAFGPKPPSLPETTGPPDAVFLRDEPFPPPERFPSPDAPTQTLSRGRPSPARPERPLAIPPPPEPGSRAGDAAPPAPRDETAVQAVPPAREAPVPSAASAGNPLPRGVRDAAQALTRANPEYPPESVRHGEQGDVVVEIVFSGHGRAESFRVRSSSGYPRLDRAALEAARRSTFRAPSVDGRPVAAVRSMVYTFQIR